MIILTKIGTTIEQYNDLVGSLPPDPSAYKETDKLVSHWMYVGTMDRCKAEELWENSIVEAMTIEGPVLAESDEWDQSPPVGVGVGVDAEQHGVQQHIVRNPDQTNRNSTGERITLPGDNILNKYTRLVEQQFSPPHLRWLSATAQQSSLHGAYYDYDDYVYDDRSLYPSPGAVVPTIYILDSGFSTSHVVSLQLQNARHQPNINQDYSGKVVRAYTSYADINNRTGHGSSMAALAAGSYSGVCKNAELVLIQASIAPIPRDHLNQAIPRRQIFLSAFQSIEQDVKMYGTSGKAVLSVSAGETVANLARVTMLTSCSQAWRPVAYGGIYQLYRDINLPMQKDTTSFASCCRICTPWV